MDYEVIAYPVDFTDNFLCWIVILIFPLIFGSKAAAVADFITLSLDFLPLIPAQHLEGYLIEDIVLFEYMAIQLLAQVFSKLPNPILENGEIVITGIVGKVVQFLLY